MIPAIRRQKLLDLLKDHKLLFLPDIIEAMDSSESTVRRDLKALAKSGEVELLRGGGVQLPKRAVEMNIQVKMQLNKNEKLRIASAASRMVHPGDIIFLDPSSVNFLLIDFLPVEHVTVVTNSITHMNKLLEKNIPCIMIGGQIKHSTSSCVGPMAERMLRELRFSKCFLGANGIDRAAGLTNHDPREQSIKHLAIDHSAVTYFLIESLKLGTVAMCKVAGVDEHTVITDRELKGMEDLHNIIVAEEEPTAEEEA